MTEFEQACTGLAVFENGSYIRDIDDGVAEECRSCTQKDQEKEQSEHGDGQRKSPGRTARTVHKLAHWRLLLL
jgi:hypothetical protein